MINSGKFALHRPEFLQPLIRGEEKIASLMSGSAFEVAAGTPLIAAETEHPYVYRLLSGWACRSRLLPDGRNQFILIFLPGDIFAVKSMFMMRHPDAINALTDVVAERVHYKTLHEAYIRDGDIASRCIWQVMEEERRLHSWIVSLGQGGADERMALLLLEFRGRLISAGMLPEPSMVYEMPLTQAQLADHLGITAVHVNRVLKEFRDSGVVTVRDGKVRITNLELLVGRASALLDTHERTDVAYVGRSAPELDGDLA